ncbi:cytochrome c biogenesis CcdA family protein [Pasteuria penetrans]|uniref:cytochrome c biogenesis CcdA family protein n=1 Tax=Pasteuria penetrans TaxID=86005 RepID=UPI000FACE196|nr:cytochrome c biogenesis protein CcdA [Pasteuria penetrans]
MDTMGLSADAVENIVESIPFLGSFLAGIFFFFSSCFLPLYPTYIAYLTGISATSLQEGGRTWATSRTLIVHSLCFVAGVSLVFYALGFGISATGSWFSTFWYDQKGTMRVIGGLVLILMGLIMAGVLQPTWLFRMQRHVTITTNKSVGYISSFLIGLGLVSGLSPCLIVAVSPVLAFITQQPDQAFGCMTLLSLGFGAPFILFAFFLSWMKFLVRCTRILQIIGGTTMIFFGVLLIIGKLNILK